MSTQPKPDEPHKESGDSAINLDPRALDFVATMMLSKIYGQGLTFDETSTALLAEFGEGIRPYLEQGEKKARELIVAEVTNLDPAETDGRLATFAIIMRADIRHGLGFAESSAKMLAEFGEPVRPYLAEAWKGAHDFIAKKLGAVGRQGALDA